MDGDGDRLRLAHGMAVNDVVEAKAEVTERESAMNATKKGKPMKYEIHRIAWINNWFID